MGYFGGEQELEFEGNVFPEKGASKDAPFSFGFPL